MRLKLVWDALLCDLMICSLNSLCYRVSSKVAYLLDRIMVNLSAKHQNIIYHKTILRFLWYNLFFNKLKESVQRVIRKG